jgi:hypothetical protein
MAQATPTSGPFFLLFTRERGKRRTSPVTENELDELEGVIYTSMEK